MGSQKRAKYTQKRKKKLREKAALVHADAALDRMHEKILRLTEERESLREEYDTLLHETFNEKKVSSRIVWLVETIFPEAEEIEAYQTACDALIVAWNVAIRGESILPDSLTPDALAIFRVLAERKKEAFPEDDRFIAEYWWEDDEDGTALVVRGEVVGG
jgi:uncharacterized coiled-coil DUF342 family protein